MRWISRPVDSSKTHPLAASLPSLGLRIPEVALPLLADLLVRRGVESVEAAQSFLVPDLSHLHNPLQMAGMKTALDRVEAAIESKEKVLIYGDYDVDGTTAIVILKTAIELCGGTADFHVPHRIREGYGMRDEVIERASADGVHLIISVDTGIRAFAAAETARRTGIDLIVTDHHLPGQDGIPPALVILNPNQSGCDYPCKYLCGAGVAFKLVQGLIERRLPDKDRSRLLMSFMKIVAIATIADAVPLLGENRVFAKFGLQGLRSPVSPGLKALLEVAKLGDGRTLTATEIAFRVAPRLNAAGRMDAAGDVVSLFCTKDIDQARQIAARLDQLNAERQEEERRILDDIELRLQEEPTLREAFCMVIDGEGWHRGVIGITATRVVEKYGRPTLIISREGEVAYGSGRSLFAFHLLSALESCAELFSRYGGHAHAVGFALPSNNLDQLREQLDRYARSKLTVADFEPRLECDGDLPLEHITPELHQALSLLEPFGMENPEPVFTARGVRMAAPSQSVKDKHVRLRVAASDSAAAASVGNGQSSYSKSSWRRNITFQAMGWGMKESCDRLQLLAGDRIDIAYSLGINEHPEFGGLELTLRDLAR